jgi:hypothetical protein
MLPNQVVERLNAKGGIPQIRGEGGEVDKWARVVNDVLST